MLCIQQPSSSGARFEGLVAAKEKEIAAATAAIEDKTQRAGETAVQIVQLQNGQLPYQRARLKSGEKFCVGGNSSTPRVRISEASDNLVSRVEYTMIRP